MITIHFNRSRSPRYQKAVKLAGSFRSTANEAGVNVLATIKDIFEHWEQFNLLFWMVIDWKGTYLQFENMNYHSHRDMASIFYSLQFSHSNWICHARDRVSKYYADGEFLSGISISERDADYLIDMFVEENYRLDQTKYPHK